MLDIIKYGYNLLRSKIRDTGLIKRSSAWPKLEKEFLAKHPVCEICGSKKKLNIHHRKPFHIFPELELDPNNLITLCMSKMQCHLLIAHGDDFKAYNPNIDADVIALRKDISKFKEVADKAKINRKYK